ncbi:MAG: NADH-quinone oxidoreductase subunit C [Bacteroidota bacterium]
MSTEDLKNSITAILPSSTFDETGEFLNVVITSEELLPLMNTLRTKSEFDFDFLFCLTCIDWKDHFMMVYHLLSKTHQHTLVIKAKIADRNNAQIETVCNIWRTAELHEREVFDLFGVKFINHPDLRRLFLSDDWVGHPLRKDYTDENMISL